MIQVHVLIVGQVQGVGYRMATWRVATGLSLQGWVRNLSDGTVEAVFVGPEAQVTKMIQWCHEGPPAASVQEVIVEPCDIEEYQGFEIR